ncbi:MAG TPA: tRNA lysidine(34) synthetase TilS [Cyclobacteriaceae bacterium]|nr:tRNA lysidine(34) synthetase TilS [Cyclobacteriaceae bacterium]
MLEAFQSYISRHRLAEPGDRILLAVSGGLDSMVMLDLFAQAGYTIGVAHANFQLRSAESDRDEGLVKQRCQELGIACYGQHFNTKNYAEVNHLSVQMAARELRYTWFNEVLEREQYHWLATAHHRDDNMETVLMRWIKGGGLDQLTGIPMRNGKIIRPLLFASRDEILAYATARKITWVEDSSNHTDNYQRNYIRHKIIPHIREINPSVGVTFESGLEKMRGSHEMMQRGLGQLKDSITRQEGSHLFIDKTLLSMLDNPAFVCYEWLRPWGFDFDRCQQMVSSLQGTSGSQFFSDTHLAVVDREAIIVSPREEWSHEILLEEGQDKAALGPWKLTVTRSTDTRLNRGADSAVLDADRIKFPLVWRKWRNGDFFVPLGLSHRKKVSDFLIDEKVSRTRKNVVTVLESAGSIVWVVGFRVDDRYKVTSETRSVLLFEAIDLK